MVPKMEKSQVVKIIGQNHPIFLGNVVRLSKTQKTRGFYVFISSTQKENFMRGGYRGVPKPKLLRQDKSETSGKE